jgi:hypothetical protein
MPTCQATVTGFGGHKIRRQTAQKRFGAQGPGFIDVTGATVLLTLLAFQVKHLVCDFIIQTRYQVDNKGFYGRIGGLIHAGWHVLFSLPVLLLVTLDARLIAGLLLGEFLVHYHTDWTKARIQRVYGWTTTDGIYWAAFGVDQFIHQATYIVMLVVVMRASA